MPDTEVPGGVLAVHAAGIVLLLADEAREAVARPRGAEHGRDGLPRPRVVVVAHILEGRRWLERR